MHKHIGSDNALMLLVQASRLRFSSDPVMIHDAASQMHVTLAAL